MTQEWIKQRKRPGCLRKMRKRSERYYAENKGNPLFRKMRNLTALIVRRRTTIFNAERRIARCIEEIQAAYRERLRIKAQWQKQKEAEGKKTP